MTTPTAQTNSDDGSREKQNEPNRGNACYNPSSRCELSHYNYNADAPDHNELLASLASANNFSMDELTANRAGKMTEAQKVRLSIQSVRPVAGALLTCMGWAIFLYGLHWLRIDTLILSLRFGVRMMIVKVAVIGFLASITFGCLMLLVAGIIKSGERTFGLMADFSTGRVAVLQGKFWASRGEDKGEGLARLFGRKTESFHYKLGEHAFEVNSIRAYEALLDREFYRAYFLPNSMLLLSIEPAAAPAWKSQGTSA